MASELGVSSSHGHDTLGVRSQREKEGSRRKERKEAESRRREGEGRGLNARVGDRRRGEGLGEWRQSSYMA